MSEDEFARVQTHISMIASEAMQLDLAGFIAHIDRAAAAGTGGNPAWPDFVKRLAVALEPFAATAHQVEAELLRLPA